MENMKRFVLLLFFAAWLSALSVQAAEPAAEGVAGSMRQVSPPSSEMQT